MLTKEIILDLVARGVSFEDAKKSFPQLLLGTYRRFGGREAPRKNGPVIGHKAIKKEETLKGESQVSLEGTLFLAARDFSFSSDILHKTLYDSLFGDGCLTKDPYLQEAHAFSQAPYLWSKAALLGKYLSSLRFYNRAGKSSGEDTMMSIRTQTLPALEDMYHLFYGTDSGVKDLMREEVYKDFDMQSLAWWLMDDGTRANPSGGLRLTIGKQEHYSLSGALRVSQWIKERTGLESRVTEEPSSYRITFVEGVSELIPYFHPNMAYKVTYQLWDRSIGTKWPSDVLDMSTLLFKGVDHPGGIPRDTTEDVTFLSSRTRARGFPFIKETEESLVAMWNKVRSEKSGIHGDMLHTPNRYNNLPSSFFPNRYGVTSGGRKSPIQMFCGKAELHDVVEKQIKSGGGREDRNIRNALSFYGGAKSAAQFNPLWAKSLVQEFLPEGGVVLDPCSGWGGRATGVASLGCSYWGIEPEPRTHEGLLELREFLMRNGYEGEMSIVRGRAEESLTYNHFEGQADMVLTCPPYYDHEKYSNHKDQSIFRFRTYATWKEGFLGEMLRNSLQKVKAGSPLVIVVGDVLKQSFVADTISLALARGATLERVIDVKVGTGEYCEKSLIFRKGVV